MSILVRDSSWHVRRVFSNRNILRVFHQNGVSLLYIMLEIHHSGLEPSICLCKTYICRPAYPKILLSVLQTAYVRIFRFLTRSIFLFFIL